MKGKAKRICAVAMVLAMLLVGLNASADNLLINGDFEGVNGSLYTDPDATPKTIASWGVNADTYLATDAETGNHYYYNSTGAATSLNTVATMFTLAPTTTTVYKLSYDYKHPSGTKMWFRFNAGNSTYDWSITNQRSPLADQWHNHSVFLYNFTQAVGNVSRIGGYTGSYLAGTWGLDNIKFEAVQNEVVFTNNYDTSGTWETKNNAGSKGDLTYNRLNFLSERIDPITTLAKANVDSETGVRTLSAQIHYLSSTAGQNVKAVTATYKEVDSKKSLVGVTVSPNAVTTAPMTSLNVGTITVPAAEPGIKYSVKVMLWSSLDGMSPLMDSSVISD